MSETQTQTRAGCGCGSLISLGLSVFFLWLNIHTGKPKCSIQDFYLPALNSSLNSTDNSTLYFQLKLKNPNILKGIYYDPVNVTVVNKSNTTTYIGNYVVPNFYQGFRKTAEKDGSVNVDKRVVSSSVFDNGTAVFRVDLVTEVRFRVYVWTTKRHRIMVGADVEVNDQGTKVDQKKNVKLSQSPLSLRFCGVLLGVLSNFLVFILLNF